MLVINNNLLALNSANHLQTNTDKKSKSVEKLSSGYRINKAADDTAGLAISEKMRVMIRGLMKGTKNVEDGISWVQTGDGALNEAHDILHRMTELTIQSLNDTNTDSDRMALEMEFESLQSELDRIGKTTQFNTLPIFEEHETPFYQFEGNIHWDPQQMHVVSAGDNDLSFTYRKSENDPPQTLTVTIPPGEYTTQELVDEIETALGEKQPGEEKFIFEFTKDGTCNVNLEKGEMIDSISGGLSYLLNKVYRGGGSGALLGTTIFPDEYSKLEVVNGENNFMSFSIQDFAGNSITKTIDLPDGHYTRKQLIDILNTQLADTTVKATAYGTGIKLASDESIVTGFKGNMFKIDGDGKVYNSVFYDNVKYGSVSQTSGVFTGGYVLPTDSRDEEHKYYRINSSNNTLVLQPNGMEKPSTITISDGEYTAKTMRDTLNALFELSGLDLTASYDTSGGFQRLCITSNEKGLGSTVNVDPSCSAFQTLFVSKEYNQYGSPADIKNETTADRDASYNASKDLLYLPASPLKISPGVNDSFKLSINGTEYTIVLTAQDYNDISDIVKELDEKLNGPQAPLAYKGQIAVSDDKGMIILKGKEGQNVNQIRVSANGTNLGYDEIFRGYSTSIVQKDISGTGSITLNTPFTGTIDPADSNLTINVDGKDHTVKLPTGQVTEQEVIDAIQNAIPPKTETIPNMFETAKAYGKTDNLNFSSTANGKETSTSWSNSATGSSKQLEGHVGFIENTPAELTIGPVLKDHMAVDKNNDKITLTLNGVTKTITLDHKDDYSPETLKNHLQTKINDAFGSSMGGAVVALGAGNQLTLTSRLPQGEDGAQTSIGCSTNNSSFLKDLNSTKTPAILLSNTALASSIVIDSSHNTFQFQLTQNGITETITLTLAERTTPPYSPSEIVSEINRKLTAQGGAVTASLSNGKLKLTSNAVGKDVSINYNTSSGGSSVEALFGPMIKNSPADMVVNQNVQQTIKIDSGINDQFTIIVNETDETVTLDDGSYSPDKFVEMLNRKLSEKNADVEAYLSGNKLGYRTKSSGDKTSLYMNYEYCGSSMKAIYGETTFTYPGITASFDKGMLVLGSTNPSSTIKVPSSSGGGFQKPAIEKNPIPPKYTDGYHSTNYSHVKGVALSGDITIDQWNNDLKFNFGDNGTNQTISIEIPKNTYKLADLQKFLQDKLDTYPGPGKINVTVDTNGVKLEAANTGSKYQFSSFQGDFYDKVMCQCTEQNTLENPTSKDGEQTVNQAYTIGRKDVRNQGADIRKGISDVLSLDLTYGNQAHKIQVTLDPGVYTGEELKEQLQEKINEQLKAIGLTENFIEVGLGGIHSGVSGSNDQNAINFSLSKTVKQPDEGQFIIDGVSGNAAFEIFYQTDGKMIPAYIIGTKDLTEGVTIGPDDTEFSLEADGTKYSITIPEGDYEPEELVTAINQGLKGTGAPVIASIENDNLKISHIHMGEHKIDQITGGARENIFFTETGDKEKKSGRFIKPNSIEDDNIVLARHIFSTSYLGINSVCISKPKYAQKALERLDKALKMTSDIRSEFGSMQNRLEHTIRNNENMTENTTAAESRLRDANMSSEMIQYASSSILEQAGQAILAHAHKSKEQVLALLA